MNLELTNRFMNILLGTRTVPFYAQSELAWTVTPQHPPDHAVTHANGRPLDSN
jgi:hypothetical protein